jgi:hypothetical protein
LKKCRNKPNPGRACSMGFCFFMWQNCWVIDVLILIFLHQIVTFFEGIDIPNKESIIRHLTK